HVQGADTAADGRGERTLDPHLERLQRAERLIRQPFAGFASGFLPGQDLHPRDPAPSFVRPLDRRVQDHAGGPPDVRARAIAFDVGYDRPVGHLERAFLELDRFAVIRNAGVAVSFVHGQLSWLSASGCGRPSRSWTALRAAPGRPAKG